MNPPRSPAAEDTPGLTGVNVVRPRAAALRALHVDPAAAPAFTGTYPGSQHNPAQCPDPRNRQASPETDPSTIT
jgi:hypothetical protein